MSRNTTEILEILSAHWKLSPAEKDDLHKVLLPAGDLGDSTEHATSLLKCAVLLDILYGNDLSRQWIKLPNLNPLFGGSSPLSKIIESKGSEISSLLRLLKSRTT
jgi:hypothetical protein